MNLGMLFVRAVKSGCICSIFYHGLMMVTGQAVALMQGKSPQQLETMVRNMAGEQGIDLNEMIRQLGINNASRR